MSFQSIRGQEAAVRILQDELSKGRINHAYLFLGQSGIGKKQLALEFAKAINCQEKIEDACDACLSCRKIAHYNHPDVNILSIEAGQSIKIEQIRRLQQDLAYKPYESSYKIAIVEQADRMTPEAANSLLKTLEEPPAYGIIILLAEEISRLLPTVISRCQKINLQDLPKELISSQLKQQGLAEQQADIVAGLANGSLGKALAILEIEDFFAKRQGLLDFLAKLQEVNNVKIFRLVDEMLDYLKIETIFPFFDLLLSWYRDIIIYKEGEEKNLVNLDFQEGIKAQGEFYTIDELLRIIQLINLTKKHLQQNVKKDLALQVMFFKIRAKRV